MNWGTHIMFIVKGETIGNFFTGTKRQCELVKMGVELMDGEAKIKPTPRLHTTKVDHSSVEAARALIPLFRKVKN
jgi:hypothetical protein